MKLYAITKGEYSDYRIITLTTDKERAERLAKLCSTDYEDATVEEYEDGVVLENRNMFQVLYYKDNSIRCNELSFEDKARLCEEPPIVRKHGVYALQYEVLVEAENHDIATKIACDVLAKYKYKEAMGE